MRNHKYTIYRAGNKTIAVSSFAGKAVRGVAKCHPNDEYSVLKGEEIAIARCAAKISKKRLRSAIEEVNKATKACEYADKILAKAQDRLAKATLEYNRCHLDAAVIPTLDE